MSCRVLHTPFFPFTMDSWAIVNGNRQVNTTERRTGTLSRTALAGLELRKAIRAYVFAYVWRHGRPKAAEGFRVSPHMFLFDEAPEGVGRDLLRADLDAAGGSFGALEAARQELMIDLVSLPLDVRPTPAAVAVPAFPVKVRKMTEGRPPTLEDSTHEPL